MISKAGREKDKAVLALIAEVYDVPAARVTLDTELRELAGDSLARVLLAVEIDKLVPVPMGEEERWTTVADVVRWAEGRTA